MKLTVKDAANLLNVSEKTIYRWIRQRTIPAYPIKGQYRFSRGELLEWASSRRIPISSEVLSEPESSDAPHVSLAESLERGGIFYRVNGFDVESALRAVVDIVRLPDEVDREFLVKVLLARELLEPTAVGEGIAIPHVRNPIVLHVQRPTLVLCFLEQAIDYGALDGVPVRVLFMLVSPTLRAHLRLLARLSYALRDPDFKQVVLGEGSRPEIVREARRVETSMASGRSPLPVETA